MEDKILALMAKSSSIKLSCEPRRCEVDTSGLALPYGREFYGLWTWEVDGQENEGPGFFKEEDCIMDMINKTGI